MEGRRPSRVALSILLRNHVPVATGWQVGTCTNQKFCVSHGTPKTRPSRVWGDPPVLFDSDVSLGPLPEDRLPVRLRVSDLPYTDTPRPNRFRVSSTSHPTYGP